MMRKVSNILMFNLEVEVTGKPVVEERLFNVTSCHRIGSDPVDIIEFINFHCDVVDLRTNNEPDALHNATEQQNTLQLLLISVDKTIKATSQCRIS